jgi:hypothetical protein
MLALASSLEHAGDWAGAEAWIKRAAEGGDPQGRAASGAGADSGVDRLVVPLGEGR